ncbi:hypothetical protein Tco_0870775, partial [Tanacetum coccineum]
VLGGSAAASLVLLQMFLQLVLLLQVRVNPIGSAANVYTAGFVAASES